MIVDDTIKRALYDGNMISEIHKGNDLAWVEKEITTTMMATGPTLNAVFNKNMTKFALADSSVTVPANATDISALGDGSVVTWYASNTQYYKPIGFDKVVLNPDSSKMFYNCKYITFISQLDTSNVTNMYGMFYYCSALTTIPELDTSKVTDMNNMFHRCTNLTSIPELNTANVTNMDRMFYYCSALNTIPSLLDTSNVINMSYMFYECNKLTTIPSLSDTSNVTDMSGMFRGCSALTTIPLLDTSNVTKMGHMFNGCTSLVTLDISTFDTAKVTNMSTMFGNCTRLTTITYSDKFVNDLCTNFTEMYKSCTANKPNWTNGTWDSNGTFTKTTT